MPMSSSILAFSFCGIPRVIHQRIVCDSADPCEISVDELYLFSFAKLDPCLLEYLVDEAFGCRR